MDTISQKRPKWSWLPIAKGALTRWPKLSNASIRHITFGENATWKVKLSDSAFALRVYRPGRWSDEQILVEHELMQTIGPTLGVLPAVKGIDGHTLQLVPETKLRAALFPWAPGRLYCKKPNRQKVRRLGQYIGTLHERLSAHSFRQQERTWDRQTLLFGPLQAAKERWKTELPNSAFPRELDEWARDCEIKWQKETPPTNLLHADLHLGNLKWSRSGICCIDFDDCGNAPLAYDLAVSAMSSGGMRDPNILTELLYGYNSVASTSIDESIVRFFMIIRKFWSMGWVSERPELFDKGELATVLSQSARTIEKMVEQNWL